MAYWDGWTYQKEITVTPPTISGAVSGFCALIRLNSTNFDFTKAKSDGADIRFGWLDAPDFTLHYIHKWDSVAEEAIVSVFIPSIPVAGTTFYLFYGNSSADDASNSTAAYYRYRTKSFLARAESGDILEFYKLENLVKVGSGVYPAVATGLNFGSSEGFDGDTVAGCWKTATGQWFNIHEYDYTVYALAYPTANDSVHRPVFAQGSLANTDFAMMLELYNGNWVFNNGVSVAANLNAWNFIAATLDFDGNMTISVNGGTPSSATTNNYDSTTDEDFYVGGSYAITTSGSERAFKGLIEFAAIGNPAYFATISSADWISLMDADLRQNSLITVEAESGGGSSSSSSPEESSSGGTGGSHFSLGWKYIAQLTITPPEDLSATVYGYPLLVKLTDTTFDFDLAKSDGSDVRFALTDGVDFLPHELVYWKEDSESSLGVFYVLIPYIPNTGTLTIDVYCGNSSASDSSSPATVWAEYEAVAHMIRDENGDIYESISGLPLTLVADSGDSYPQSTDGHNHPAEQFAGDSEANYWKFPDGILPDMGAGSSEAPTGVSIEILNHPSVYDSNDRPLISQGNYTDEDYSLFVERWQSVAYFHDELTANYPNDTWTIISAYRASDGSNAYIRGYEDSEDTGAVPVYSPADISVCIGGTTAVTTNGSERAFSGIIEEVRVSFVSRDLDWHKLLEVNLIAGTMTVLGVFTDNPNAYEPVGEDEEGPIDSNAVVVDAESDQIISASVSFEPQGVASASLSSKYEIAVGTYVTIPDPITDVNIFRGIVTKCSYNYKTHRYDIQLRDPLMALSQESVLFSQTNMVSVLHEVATDYGQAFYSVVGTDFEFAPVEVGSIIDPDNEVESDPIDWVGLVRTAERATGGVMTYRPNGQYRFDYPTSRGALSSSLLIQATTGLKDRYANRAICKCTGEWWEDTGEETTSTEFIYGAYRTVKRYGDQIRSISITTSDLSYTETFTYDADSYLTKHEVVSVQEDNSPLSGIARYRTTTTREWTITDEANYVYEEEVINEQQLEGEGSYANLDRTVKTVTVTGGEILETFQRYGWNYESGWHVLMNDYTITGSGDEINAGDGSYYEIRGFLAQPGLTSYGVKSIYEYVWIDEIEGTYRRRLQKTEVLSSVVSEPGFKRVLPLKKYAVNYCVTADDTPAQTALGLMETFYTPITVKDDASLTAMKTIAEATLEWLGRCRLLMGTIPLSTGETWRVGDTFTWGGLTWTLEGLEHDIKARLTNITATSEASIAWLKKSLLSEKDRLGNTIKGIARKEAEKYDNVEYATIIRMVDHETYVVKLSDGTVKIAHISFGEGVLLPAGSNVTVLRESLK